MFSRFNATQIFRISKHRFSNKKSNCKTGWAEIVQEDNEHHWKHSYVQSVALAVANSLTIKNDWTLPQESLSPRRFSEITSQINIRSLTTWANLFDILYCSYHDYYYHFIVIFYAIVVNKPYSYVYCSSICPFTYRHLWADCLENMEASTSHNPMGLHGPLQG
jgi:hypothetical protein